MAALILGVPAAAVGAQSPFDFDSTPGALPKDVVPIEYALHIVPDIAARRFRGIGTYRIEVRQPTARLVLHALEIEIGSASLRSPGGARVRLGAPQRDGEMFVFTLPKPLPRGLHTLELAWYGKINTAVQGLYADPYRTPAGERVILATDMEPGNARRLLPSWDEPSFRARFRLSVDLPPGFSGYSNMPVARRQGLPGGGQRLAFAATPKMPTYLLALVAGEMERVTSEVEGVEIGIVFTPGRAGRTAYALAASGELLRYFNDYFGTRYPLPKLDHIALPGGFPGGMENWGAIVYNEANFLVDPATTPERVRQIAYGLVAHEIAHQWFGNLVTMAWWDDLWLNEAFAEWMASKASDRFHPQWHVWLGANEGRELAMDLDARASSHPIQQPVATESEADSAFDRITYEKGGAFLRMLEAWLGEEAFRSGIRAYMAKHRYSNTTGADFWAALGAASGKPVGAIAESWITQSGFPLISVEARCEGGERRVTLRQQPFLLGAAAAGAPKRWRVPIELAAGTGAAGTYALLDDAEATRSLPSCDGALLLDAGGAGFYRVRYSPPLFDALLADWARLPDAARLRLLSDTSALMRADAVPVANWLALVRKLGDEPRLALWLRVVDEIDTLDRLFVGEAARPALHRFALDLLAPRFARLGWDEKAGETTEDRLLRGVLAGALLRYGDVAAVAEARSRFARFLADPASLQPEIAEAVLRSAGREADAATWERIRQLAEAAQTSQERFRYYRALSQVREPMLAARSLELAISPAVPQIVRQDMVSAVARNGHLPAAWDFARANVDRLLANVTQNAGGRYFGEVVDSAASPAFADELEAFVAARLPASAQPDAHRAADEIRTRALLKARLVPQLEAVLPLP